MNDPVEIMARAAWSDFEITAPFDTLSPEIKENVRGEMRAAIAAIEAAGFRLLSAEGVTEEMVDAADRANPTNDSESVTEAEIRAAILAAPLFGKGSEKP